MRPLDHTFVPELHDSRREYDALAAAKNFSADWYCTKHSTTLLPATDFLVCPAGHQIPVRNGVPRFVAGKTYADAFGEQWNYFRRTQLDSYSGLPISRTRLKRCLGADLWTTLAGSRVLECGCGAGRFTEVLLEEGANVVSIDLSNAVDANVLNCPLGPAHVVAQADIADLPFHPQSFDIVLCLGVLQHTPNPEGALTKLYDQVAPGGSLVVDHYRLDWRWYTRTAPLFRLWLKRLSPEKSLRITNSLVDMLLPIHKKTSSVKGLRSLVGHLSPLMAYYGELPDLPENLQWEWARLDTHDSLTDWYKHFRRRSQIIRKLKSLGATSIWCELGGNGIEARAKRPANEVTPAGQPALN